MKNLMKIFESTFNAINNIKPTISQEDSIPPLFKWYQNLNVETTDIYSLLKENENLGQLNIRLAEEYKEIESFSKERFCQYLSGQRENDDTLEVLEKHNRLQSIILQIFVDRNNKGIEFEKCNNLELAIKCYEENIKDGVIGTHPYDRLGVIYRNRKDVENEKRVLCRKYENYKFDNDDLKKELKRIEDRHNGVKPKYILPKEPITIPAEKNNTLGSEFENIKKKLPEFDFYINKPDDISTNDYLWSNHNLINDKNYKPQIWEIQKKFKSMIEEAQALEKDYNLALASAIYEEIINEQYYLPTPYDRLIKIYSKAKLTSHEKRVLELSITFFKALRERQREYVISLAKKVAKLDFCTQRINNNEKIFYYGGSFELYNPFLIIEKWEERHIKTCIIELD